MERRARAVLVTVSFVWAGERLLLIRLSKGKDRFAGLWNGVGGKVRRGEDIREAACREVREETGLTVVIESHVGDWVRRGFRPHTAAIYRCRVVGGSERPSHETPRLAWFDVEHPPAELFPWYREPLARAIGRDEAPVTRHDWQGVVTIWQAMKIDLRLRWRGLP